MNRRDLLRESQVSMHGLLDKAVSEMSAEQLNFRPQEGGVSGFFSLWHFVRTEDNVINWVLQQQPTVWLNGDYDELFALPRTSQGTGMTEDEANAVTISDVPKFLQWQCSRQPVLEAWGRYPARPTTARPILRDR